MDEMIGGDYVRNASSALHPALYTLHSSVRLSLTDVPHPLYMNSKGSSLGFFVKGSASCDKPAIPMDRDSKPKAIPEGEIKGCGDAQGRFQQRLGRLEPHRNGLNSLNDLDSLVG